MPAVVYPIRTRATGAGFGAATGRAGAVVVTLFFPLLIDGIGLPATVEHGRRSADRRGRHGAHPAAQH
jgi:hypothetical protein